MMEKFERMIRQELQGIRLAVRTAPSGTRNRVSNRCSRLTLIFKKMMNEQQKHIARRAIYDALTNGRRLSQMDCREFEVEDMRTPVSHMRQQLADDGYILNSQWIKTPKGRRIKEYWLEKQTIN